MPKFAANLSMLYPEHEFLQRFEAAARDGFRAVEYLFPYEHEPAELAARLKANGLQQVLFNGPPGNWSGGERGMACLVWPAFPAARPSSARASPRRCAMPRRWAARAFT
jgi:2-dehydrotetronate isomerase